MGRVFLLLSDQSFLLLPHGVCGAGTVVREQIFIQRFYFTKIDDFPSMLPKHPPIHLLRFLLKGSKPDLWAGFSSAAIIPFSGE